jgi:aspartyl protease family protein
MIRDAATGAIALLVVSIVGVNLLSDRQPPAPRSDEIAARKPAKNPQTASQPLVKGGIGVVLEPDNRGHYAAEMIVDGVRFPAMVDTGASIVALPQSVAERIGLFPGPEQFTQTVSTANGRLKVAPVRLSNLTLGPIRLQDVEAVVIPDGRLDKTLLGMSFLGRLKGFEIREGQLHLSN